MANDSDPTPAQIWARAMKTWTDAWTAPLGVAGAHPTGGAGGDPFRGWQQSIDECLAAWTAGLEKVFQSPETVAASGRLLDNLLNVEKPLRERTAAAMELWLEFVNLPSRGDLIRVAVQLNDANARLDELQILVESLADQVAGIGDVLQTLADSAHAGQAADHAREVAVTAR